MRKPISILCLTVVAGCLFSIFLPRYIDLTGNDIKAIDSKGNQIGYCQSSVVQTDVEDISLSILVAKDGSALIPPCNVLHSPVLNLVTNIFGQTANTKAIGIVGSKQFGKIKKTKSEILPECYTVTLLNTVYIVKPVGVATFVENTNWVRTK